MGILRLAGPAVALACAFFITAGASAADVTYPPTMRRPVVDTYHGVAVTDVFGAERELERIQAPIEASESDRENARLLRDWEDPGWANWKPPRTTTWSPACTPVRISTDTPLAVPVVTVRFCAFSPATTNSSAAAKKKLASR